MNTYPILLTGKNRIVLETFRYWLLSFYEHGLEVETRCIESDVPVMPRRSHYALHISLVLSEGDSQCLNKALADHTHGACRCDAMIAVVDSDCSSVESPVHTVGGVPVISVALSRCMDVVGAVLKRRCQILPAQGVSEGVPEQEKPLTPRESEIMDQIAKGSSLKEISYTLGISYHTVNAHKRNLFLKTGARTLRQLSLYAILHARTGAG